MGRAAATRRWPQGEQLMNDMMHTLETIHQGLAGGEIIAYLGPETLALCADAQHVPATPEALVERLTAKVTVPFKIRNNLTAAAQYVENFKHRTTVRTLVAEAFTAAVQPSALHRYLAALQPPLIVAVWYDAVMQVALREAGHSWGMIQGVSQAEKHGHWVEYRSHDGAIATAQDAQNWHTVLYQPLGSVAPDKNFIVSDSDYVEVLTEIDIQTPIPELVKTRRSGRNFLFLGCRFRNQLERNYARQIMKRSSAKHWAVLPEDCTRNELRFLEEQHITRIAMSLAEFAATFDEPLEAAVGC
jgi:hypothetical protein